MHIDLFLRLPVLCVGRDSLRSIAHGEGDISADSTAEPELCEFLLANGDGAAEGWSDTDDDASGVMLPDGPAATAMRENARALLAANETSPGTLGVGGSILGTTTALGAATPASEPPASEPPALDLIATATNITFRFSPLLSDPDTDDAESDDAESADEDADASPLATRAPQTASGVASLVETNAAQRAAHRREKRARQKQEKAAQLLQASEAAAQLQACWRGLRARREQHEAKAETEAVLRAERAKLQAARRSQPPPATGGGTLLGWLCVFLCSLSPFQAAGAVPAAAPPGSLGAFDWPGFGTRGWLRRRRPRAAAVAPAPPSGEPPPPSPPPSPSHVDRAPSDDEDDAPVQPPALTPQQAKRQRRAVAPPANPEESEASEAGEEEGEEDSEEEEADEEGEEAGEEEGEAGEAGEEGEAAQEASVEQENDPQMPAGLDAETSKVLESVKAEMGKLEGLEEAKATIWSKLFAVIDKKHYDEPIKIRQGTANYNVVIVGESGVGKTTIARKLLHEPLVALGVLRDKFERVSAQEVQGKGKLKEALKKAKGGTQLIDEAYGLTKSTAATTELVFQLHKDDCNVMVIAAGYKNRMDQWIASNEGLTARFPTYLHLPNYDVDQLISIGTRFVSEQGFAISTDAAEALREAAEYVTTIPSGTSPANADAIRRILGESGGAIESFRNRRVRSTNRNTMAKELTQVDIRFGTEALQKNKSAVGSSGTASGAGSSSDGDPNDVLALFPRTHSNS